MEYIITLRVFSVLIGLFKGLASISRKTSAC